MTSKIIELEQRREPVQERGRQRVEAILEAVQTIIMEDGVEAVTTHRIAKQAGIPVGSVYQYFPNKYAIFRAHVKTFHDRLNGLYSASDQMAAQGVSGFDRLDWLLESLVELWGLEHNLIALWTAVRRMPEMEEIFMEQDRLSVAYNLKWLQRAYPQLPEERRRVIAKVVHRIIDSLLLPANAGTEQDKVLITDELKRLVKGYFSSIAEEHKRLLTEGKVDIHD